MKKLILILSVIIYSTISFSQDTICYIVQPGDNLYRISLSYNVPIYNIFESNPSISDLISPGDTVKIPLPYTDSRIEKRECLKTTYDSQVGIRELSGNNDGKEVEMYLKSAGLGKGYPWCASFVYWTFTQCGDTLDIRYPAWVPSYFPENKLIYVRGEFSKRSPLEGDLIGIWFNSKNRLAHIGFYDGENGDFILTVEGNTNEAGSREGDGVYRKRRIKRQIHSISSWLK